MNTTAVDLARDLVEILTLDLDHDPVIALDRDLDFARALALALALAHDLSLARTAGDRGQHGPGRVAPSAERLLDAAARLLPAADRARYAEEYRSELREIAHSGRSRRRQLRYASRQLASSVPCTRSCLPRAGGRHHRDGRAKARRPHAGRGPVRLSSVHPRPAPTAAVVLLGVLLLVVI